MREVERKALLDEISKMAENLLPLPEYGSKVERLMRDITGESMERLAMVKVQLGMYLAEVTQKAKETFVIKEELLQLRHCLSRCVFCEVGELEKRIDELVAEPIVAKEELNALAQEVKMVEEREEEIARSVRETQNMRMVVGAMEETLKELGYEPLSGINFEGEPIYVDTPWIGYKVKLVFNRQGEALVKLVRIFRSEEEKNNETKISKAKNVEIAKEWCGHYTRWIEKLREMGIVVEERWRREPEEFGVEVEVNEALASHDDRKRERKQLRTDGKKTQRFFHHDG